jgi:hypothetical protein
MVNCPVALVVKERSRMSTLSACARGVAAAGGFGRDPAEAVE